MNVHASALAEAHRLDEPTSAFARDVIGDLSRAPKRLSPKYFYDATGSELFEQITVLAGILPDPHRAFDPARPGPGDLDDHSCGRGAGRIRRRRDHQGAAVARRMPARRLRSRRHLRRIPQRAGGKACAPIIPTLAIHPVTADFTAPFELPEAVRDMPKVGFFPGSTLGNFEPGEACTFLKSARAILGNGGRMVIGVDLEKDERTLYDAYNDTAGVTARFNLNVLHRINRELGGDFDVGAFIHRAIYNRDRHRIEMHLISKKAFTAEVLGKKFSFRPGESIHTESSYKYSIERFALLARVSGWIAD